MRRVSPQARGIIPPDDAQRLAAARDAKEAADDEFRSAVVDALKAGGSIREVAQLAEISTRTVQDWGHAGGWPTAEQKRARETARERRAEEMRALLARFDAQQAKKQQKRRS